MSKKKETRAILYVRGVTARNKRYLERKSKKEKVSVAKLMNEILDEQRSRAK